MVTIGKIEWSPDYSTTEEDKEFRRKVREVFDEWVTEKPVRREPKCLFDMIIENNPEMAGRPLWISCPCPKCSIRI